MVDLFTSNLSITKQIFNRDAILNYFKAFSDYLQVCLADIESAKDNDFRGNYTGGIYSIGSICVGNTYSIRVSYT